MPFQYSPPAGQTISWARAQSVLTKTPRAPLDGTPEAAQLGAYLDRGPIIEGTEPFRKKGRVPRRSRSFSGVVVPFTGITAGGPTLALSNEPVSHQSDPSLLAIMQQMNQIMANLQEDSRPHYFKPQSMKAPDCFYGTQPSKS
ncbi:hypothetical protein O181_070298 [Austropuccinia psidii MF-1]|uniref:Uncharacterized protein n=1 Tax=Austropuccinia psidii MF-1 TaxID=1389203 RepID=A0A9Q3EYU8_9BASI|nr:hypothetical protein [Austropuccinia psidii MF-1]